MRRVQVWVWLYLALGYALAPPSAVAQAAGGAAEQGKAGEFSRLYERWQQAQDPEERIKLGEHAFALEAAVTAWELAVPRERVRGELWFGIGNAYYDRRQGNRADNLEKAIAAYEAALTVRIREALSREWASAQHNLGCAGMEPQAARQSPKKEPGASVLRPTS